MPPETPGAISTSPLHRHFHIEEDKKRTGKYMYGTYSTDRERMTEQSLTGFFPKCLSERLHLEQQCNTDNDSVAMLLRADDVN